MLKNFINSYKSAYFKIFSDDFYGDFKRFEQALLEPKFHPSAELKNELGKLDLFLCEPAQVAIVGQFSSGKSTFLNALLGQNVLPTGVTPVTARLTHIKYGENFSLRVDYKNGKELNLNISEIEKFVDQRVFNDDVKDLCIYAPLEILKRVNFIDTPGLNSLSSSDTNITKEVLSDVCGVVWLSLIENAARASELSQINELVKSEEKSAICVLNQKDKLTKAELDNVMTHAKVTFDGIFKEIIPISAKQANLARENGDEALANSSNFKTVLEAIENTFANEEIKQNFVLKKCKNISQELISEHEYFMQVYEKGMKILSDFDENLEKNLALVKQNFSPKIEIAFNEIKQIAKVIADEIVSSMKPKKMRRFEHKKTLLKGKKIDQIEYEIMSFDNDEIFSKLIYNDVKLAKFFRIYRQNLKNLQDELCTALSEIYENLESEFLIYKSEFEGVRKESAVHSDIEFATIRAYAGRIYELVLRDFEAIKFAKIQTLLLFFEKLNLKIITNYENAIKIAVHFIKEKIENSIVSHEKDPINFSVYIPSANEIYERVLISLNLYEFENEMLSNASFLNKILSNMRKEFKETKEAKEA
ncbi:dynamin family protein, partial [Campylobacter sp. RM9328]|uniref:dynamin family protein n=1 Tax=Campylobacter sp. RM9328 TaxID=1705720 RepID=UPI0014758D27